MTGNDIESKRVVALISFIAPDDIIAEQGQELELERGLALDLEILGLVRPVQNIADYFAIYADGKINSK